MGGGGGESAGIADHQARTATDWLCERLAAGRSARGVTFAFGMGVHLAKGATADVGRGAFFFFFSARHACRALGRGRRGRVDGWRRPPHPPQVVDDVLRRA